LASAFDGGADDGGKFAEDGTLVFGAERNGGLDGPKQLFPIAQQEEEQLAERCIRRVLNRAWPNI
jgi:hypothetical protein